MVTANCGDLRLKTDTKRIHFIDFEPQKQATWTQELESTDGSGVIEEGRIEHRFLLIPSRARVWRKLNADRPLDCGSSPSLSDLDRH